MGKHCFPQDLPMMSRIFRITAIQRRETERGYAMTARLYHDRASVTVDWAVRQPDTRLKPGVLVSPRWSAAPQDDSASVRVASLILLERPERSENLFFTVPTGWVADRSLLARAARLWEGLPLNFQEMFNALFWNGARFERFCRSPGSLRGHHCGGGDNLRHAVEVAEAMLALLPSFPNANPAIAVTAGLLHDAAKGEDYRPGLGNPWHLTDWGRLVAHKPTITLWIGEVHGRLRARLTDAQLQSLLHALNAARAPAWLGMRAPVTPEAIMLSLADRASGNGDLMIRQQADGGGWGRSHPHLDGMAPYTVPVTPAKKTMPGMEAFLERMRVGSQP